MSAGRAAIIRSTLGLVALVVATFGLFGRLGHVLWELIVAVMAIDIGRLVVWRCRRSSAMRRGS